MNVAPAGDLVRGIHFWVANIVMATVLLHMGRVFVTGSYKRPREANWLIGLGLLGVTLGLIFTGTVLNQTGQAVEVVMITMAVYLSISLVTSMVMNWYNARIALVER